MRSEYLLLACERRVLGWLKRGQQAGMYLEAPSQKFAPSRLGRTT